MTRIERNGLAEVCHCAIGIAFGVIRDAAITPGVGQTRVEFDGFVELGDRPVELSPISKTKTAFVIILGGARRLRLSSAGCERQRERRRSDYCHNDSMAEHLVTSFG